VRVVGIERFAVSEYFPKLTRALVPDGILDADYTIALPDIAGPPVSE
jgi:hypothetical protein